MENKVLNSIFDTYREIRPEIYLTAESALKKKFKSNYDFDVFQDAIWKFLTNPDYEYRTDKAEVGYIMRLYFTTFIDAYRRAKKSVSYDALLEPYLNGEIDSSTLLEMSYQPTFDL